MHYAAKYVLITLRLVRIKKYVIFLRRFDPKRLENTFPGNSYSAPETVTHVRARAHTYTKDPDLIS